MIMRDWWIYAPAVTTVLRNLTILEGPRAGPESRIIGGRRNLDKIERGTKTIPMGGWRKGVGGRGKAERPAKAVGGFILSSKH